MGLFDRIEDRIANKIISGMQNATTTTTDITQDTSINLDWDETSSGSVTEDTAMQIPALSSGVDLIASSIANLPVKLYKINEYGEKEEIHGDNRVNMLNISPNLFDSAYNLKYGQVKQLILHGTTFTYMQKDKRNNLLGLYLLDSQSVNAQSVKYGNGLYGYQFSFSIFNDYYNNVEQFEVLTASKDKKRSEDILGVGVLEKGKDILSLALAELNSASGVMEGQVDSYLSTPNALSPTAKSNIRQTWKGFKTSRQIPILEEGLEYKTVSKQSAKEMELLDSRRYSTELICQLLSIPFTYLLSSATSYNNSEHESLRFMKTLLPYITILEEAYNKFLLTTKELEQNYRFQFDTSTILKASPSEQMAYLREGVNGGLLSINEARSQLGLQATEGGDILEVPVNSYILDMETGEIRLPSAEYELKKEQGEDEKVEEKDEEIIEEEE